MNIQNSDEREGDCGYDQQRCEEALEPANDKDIDQRQDRCEGNTETPENLIRDVPLSIPFDGITPIVYAPMPPAASASPPKSWGL